MLSAPQVSLTRDHVLCQKAAHVAGNHLAIFFVRRSPRQREPIGDVRATVAYFAPSWLEMPFEEVGDLVEPRVRGPRRVEDVRLVPVGYE